MRPGGIAALIALAWASTSLADDTATGASTTGRADTVDGDEAPGYVAFTFDDGPKPGTTDKVIDALLAYDVPATFFVVGHRITGKRAQPSRDLIARMVEHGFLVGNHSFSHPNLRTVSGKKLSYQIDHTSEVIEELTGTPTTLFRPPFGALDKESAAVVAKAGLTNVMWSVDSLDWRRPKAERMRKAIVDGIFNENGGVVLMHDTKLLTAKTIAGILDDLEARNCARLDAGEPAIIPVSIHYFLKDGDTPREIPAEVEARTQAYRFGLPARCAKRTESKVADQ
jgi:peptidoglycan/xylan/chitin deacetylase (PgdA/CDA1 family)